MRRAVKIFGLEFILKGGFFVSGLMIYFQSKESFSKFTLLNSVFTLAYNAIALGLPFIYARELHKREDFRFGNLSTLIAISTFVLLVACILFPAKILYCLAGALMVVVDVVYSKFRMLNVRYLGAILIFSGLVVFSGNILAGVFLDESWRYYGILASGVLALTLILTKTGLRSEWKLSSFSNVRDGLSFGGTHALFWVRNGLDKVMLFPLIGSTEYARYGLFFFFVSAMQTAWTSVIRISQKYIFDIIVTKYRMFVGGFSIFTLISAVAVCILLALRVDYGAIIVVGAFVHFGNQVFVNLINYYYPTAFYTASNAVVAVGYLIILKLVGVSVYLLAALFAVSNLALSFLYLLLVFWPGRSLEKRPAVSQA